jgi:hypothetical protein
MSIKINQEVEITPSYVENYPSWNPGLGKVVSMETKTINSSTLSKESRLPFVAKYGKLDNYPLISFLVDFSGTQYLMSEFGIQLKQ